MITSRILLMVGLIGCCLAGCTEIGLGTDRGNARGKLIFSKECASCHGKDGSGAGPESLGIGVIPPDLTQLSARNDGAFPREFVRRFVMGLLEDDMVDKTMPRFSKVGLRHVYPSGGADGEILEADFADLVDYLSQIQE